MDQSDGNPIQHSPAINHPKHALRMPTAAARRGNPASRQFCRHLPRGYAGAFQFRDDGCELARSLDSPGLHALAHR
jgi:hypothetical protein